MITGVTASPASVTVFPTSRTPLTTRERRCFIICSSSNLELFSHGLLKSPRINFRCYSSGENASKTVLDAFFLGKAVGEVFTERIESTVGEFLSVIGRLQAEQQKQVSEFQEVVLEKARRAKEAASGEIQGAVSSDSTSLGVSTPDGVSGATSRVSKEDPLLGMLNMD